MFDYEVTRGVTFVREHYGHDWFNKVSLDKFDIGDARNCILGHLQGDYWEALSKWNMGHGEAETFGFNAPKVNQRADLQAEWVRRIKNLRESFGATRPLTEPEREPTVWVDLTAHTSTGNVSFPNVGGIAYRDSLLTFENEDGRLFYVPNVTHWTTDASEV